MPNVTKKNLIIRSVIVWKWNNLFTKNYFRKKKVNYCYGFMSSNFQVICGSVVAENCWLLASTETPGELPVLLWQNIFSDNFSSIKNVFITIPWIFERFLYRHILQLFLQAHSAGITSWWLNEQYIRYFPEKVIWYIV